MASKRATGRPRVRSLPPGTEVAGKKILAHHHDEGTVDIQCLYCGNRSTIALLNFYSKKGCGCTQVNTQHVHSLTKSDRGVVDSCNEQIDQERLRYIPAQLRDVWKYRTISDRWHKDNPDRYLNFMLDVGNRPPNHMAGWINPAGDFTPENFCWIPYDASNEGSDQATVPEGAGEVLPTREGQGP